MTATDLVKPLPAFLNELYYSSQEFPYSEILNSIGNQGKPSLLLRFEVYGTPQIGERRSKHPFLGHLDTQFENVSKKIPNMILILISTNRDPTPLF